MRQLASLHRLRVTVRKAPAPVSISGNSAHDFRSCTRYPRDCTQSSLRQSPPTRVARTPPQGRAPLRAPWQFHSMRTVRRADATTCISSAYICDLRATQPRTRCPRECTHGARHMSRAGTRDIRAPSQRMSSTSVSDLRASRPRQMWYINTFVANPLSRKRSWSSFYYGHGRWLHLSTYIAGAANVTAASNPRRCVFSATVLLLHLDEASLDA